MSGYSEYLTLDFANLPEEEILNALDEAHNVRPRNSDQMMEVVSKIVEITVSKKYKKLWYELCDRYPKTMDELRDEFYGDQPKTISELVEEIYEKWGELGWKNDQRFIDAVKTQSAEDFAIGLHDSAGRNLRNKFFWDSGTRLHAYCRSIGLSHADDMSHQVLLDLHKYATEKIQSINNNQNQQQ